MKALFSLLIIIFLFQYSKETACNSKSNPSVVKDCIEIELEEEENKCCLFSYSINDTISIKEEKLCIGLTEEQYEDIKNVFKTEVEKRENKEKGITVQHADIDCGTNYLIVSILSLIILLL